jgi:hypothetical protein
MGFGVMLELLKAYIVRMFFGPEKNWETKKKN